jgi:DNA-binding response OmpR family regulator
VVAVRHQTDDLVVNLDTTKTIEVNGSRVHLTSKEYQILELLSLRKGATLTKDKFLNHLLRRNGRAGTDTTCPPFRSTLSR